MDGRDPRPSQHGTSSSDDLGRVCVQPTDAPPADLPPVLVAGTAAAREVDLHLVNARLHFESRLVQLHRVVQAALHRSCKVRNF